MKLKINLDKTEFIFIAVEHTSESLKPNFTVLILQTFSKEVTFDNHIAKVCGGKCNVQ